MSRIAVGDIIAIPVDEHEHCIAQVIAPYPRSHFYIAAFGLAPRPNPPTVVGPDVLDNGEMVLLGLTNDARVRPGMWAVVGAGTVSQRTWLPGHLTATAPGQYIVMDHAGRRRRTATASECARVRHRTTVSPMVLELAVQAWAGRRAWQTEFDDFLPGMQVPERELFPG